MISIYDLPALEQLSRQLKIDPIHLRRMHASWLKKQVSTEQVFSAIPDQAISAHARSIIRDEVRLESLRQMAVFRSRIDPVARLVWQTEAERLVESVLMRYQTGRVALCISSQSGCAAGCVFCESGRLRPVVDLRFDEILDQLLLANRYLARRSAIAHLEADLPPLKTVEIPRVRNVVVMGMGEPLHNFEHVARAVETMISPLGFNMTPRRVTVSTVGIPDLMVRFARRFPEVRLAVSLHAAEQTLRESLMPIARKYSLHDLHAAMREVAAIEQQPVMIEYLLLEGVNDSRHDAERLVRYLGDLPAHVNLIAYNTPGNSTNADRVDGENINEGENHHRPGSFRSPGHEAVWRFAQWLQADGLTVTRRHSHGADIEAACGQLAARLQK